MCSSIFPSIKNDGHDSKIGIKENWLRLKSILLAIIRTSKIRHCCFKFHKIHYYANIFKITFTKNPSSISDCFKPYWKQAKAPKSAPKHNDLFIDTLTTWRSVSYTRPMNRIFFLFTSISFSDNHFRTDTIELCNLIMSVICKCKLS